MDKNPTTVSKKVKRNKQIRDTTRKGEDCPLLHKAPYVCNGCPKRRLNCGYQKEFYIAKKAQEKYQQVLVETRKGTPLNKETFWEMEKAVSKGLKKGQYIYHILKTNDLNVSSSSVYRYTKKGYLSVSPIDLLRAIKFKKRRQRT